MPSSLPSALYSKLSIHTSLKTSTSLALYPNIPTSNSQSLTPYSPVPAYKSAIYFLKMRCFLPWGAKQPCWSQIITTLYQTPLNKGGKLSFCSVLLLYAVLYCVMYYWFLLWYILLFNIVFSTYYCCVLIAFSQILKQGFVWYCVVSIGWSCEYSISTWINILLLCRSSTLYCIVFYILCCVLFCQIVFH